MSHTVAVRDGMSSSAEAALSNIAVAFIDTAGVVGTSDYLVEAQLTPDNTVKINIGRAYVSTVAEDMKYSTLLSAVENVTIAANNSGNPRIDAIVLYIDLAAAPDATATNVAKFYDVTGTPAGSPVAPTNAQILAQIGASNPYIILSNIAVANGFTSIISANITDTRTFTTFNTGPTFQVPGYIEMTEQASPPSSPASGKVRLYIKADALFRKLPSGGIAQIGNTTINDLGSVSGAQTIDFSLGLNHALTMTNTTTLTFTNPVQGEHYVVEVKNGDTGTLNYPVNVLWNSNTPPSLGLGINKIDLLGFFYDGTYFIGMMATRY